MKNYGTINVTKNANGQETTTSTGSKGSKPV